MQALFSPACPAAHFYAEPKGARPPGLPQASGRQEPESLQVVEQEPPSLCGPSQDGNKKITVDTFLEKGHQNVNSI